MRAPGPDTASVESNWASKNVPDVGGDVCNVQVPLKPAFGIPLPLPSHVATNPDAVVLPSEVKSTCKYPADDVYTLLELTEPDSRAICSVAEPLHTQSGALPLHWSEQPLHDDDVQRLMVT